MKNCEDWDMYLRIARDFKFKFIDRPLYLSFIGTDNQRFDISKSKVAERLIRDKTARYLKKEKGGEYVKYRLSWYYLSGFITQVYASLINKARY